MTLAAHEFIRRFLLHVLPQGFHRIRHYGLFANGGRAENLDRARRLLCVPTPQREPDDVNADEPPMLSYPRPSCGGRMIVIETFEPGYTPWRHGPRAPPPSKADRLGSRPPRAASSPGKTRQRHRKAVATGLAAGQIFAVQQTTQRPHATLPPSNPHRPSRLKRRA